MSLGALAAPVFAGTGTVYVPLQSAAPLAGLNFRATLAEAIADFPVGDYFTSAETGQLRVYRRIATSPYYADQGDEASPLTRGFLAMPAGANGIGFVAQGRNARPRTLQDKVREFVSAKDYGAVADGIILSGTTIAAGSPVVAAPGASFEAADVGKTISIPGAGPSGQVLVTTIGSRISAERVSLQQSASTSVTNGEAIYGTDDTDAIQAALDASAHVEFPAGVYLHRRLILKFNGQVLRGMGRSITILHCPLGFSFTNFAGTESDPVRADWIGDPVWERMTLRGGFRHRDDFRSPANSWAYATGRSKPVTTSGINAGIRLKRCHPYTLRDVEVTNFHRAVYLSAAALGRWSNFLVSDCEIGCWGENGAKWGDPAWQITTHSWRDGRFRNCWIGIAGSDYAQCQIDGKSVDFEPCNTGIAITNGGDNAWSGYFELCSEGIYRNGSHMGHDVIDDPFFAGKAGSYWGMGDSILLDAGIGAEGKITLRDGARQIGGGGLRILGGRLSRPDRHRGTLLFLGSSLVPKGGNKPDDLQWIVGDGYDDAQVFDPSSPTRFAIPHALDGAKIKFRAQIMMDGDEIANDVLCQFTRNGRPFPGTGRFSGVFTNGCTLQIETAAIRVSAKDTFSLEMTMNLPRRLLTNDCSWVEMIVLE